MKRIQQHGQSFLKEIKTNRMLLLMLLPVLAYYLIFHYYPMWGAQIAFRQFNFSDGIFGSPWIGFKNFTDFFHSYYFFRLIRNTLLLSIYNLLWGFPLPVIFALLINEIKSEPFRRSIQTVTYLPHFVSTVVVCGLILDFFARDGLINQLTGMLGIESVAFMVQPEWFRTIYIATDIWQQLGWGSIIYLAALTNIDMELYDACKIDGANRFRQMLSVTLPGIAPTIIIMLLLRVSRIMNVGSEKVLLLYNSNTYETADIISTFVYRRGILGTDYSFTTAVGLFNSLVNFTLLVVINKISKKVSEVSLW